MAVAVLKDTGKLGLILRLTTSLRQSPKSQASNFKPQAIKLGIKIQILSLYQEFLARFLL
jgi:hypothetical protein